MKALVIIRNGEIKKRFMGTVESDGRVLNGGETYLIDMESPESQKIGRAGLTYLSKGRKWSEIPADCFAHYGENPSGLIVLHTDEYYEQEGEKTRAVMTPAEQERNEIHRLFERADRRQHDTDDGNTADHFRLRGEASRKYDRWVERYPDEAREERAAEVRGQADAQRSLATGALLYDCDGSLDREQREARHDEFLAKAEDLERQAGEISKNE